MINIKETVQKLLDSDVSGYRIAKESGITTGQIKKLRNKVTIINEVTVKNAQKLIYFYEVVENKKYK